MMPFCAKKAEDLRIMIDHLEGNITGNQAIERYNQEVRVGRRSGFFRDLTLPCFREEGLRTVELENAKKARAAHAVNISPETREKIRNEHREGKLGQIRLSRKYGYSVKVIRRVLGAA
jgi:hypothetical protein